MSLLLLMMMMMQLRPFILRHRSRTVSACSVCGVFPFSFNCAAVRYFHDNIQRCFSSISKSQPLIITSATNSKVQLFKGLLSYKKKRDASQLIVLEGGRMIRDALTSSLSNSQLKPHTILMTAEAFKDSKIGQEIKECVDKIDFDDNNGGDANDDDDDDEYKSSEPVDYDSKNSDSNNNGSTTSSTSKSSGGIIHIITESVYKNLSDMTRGQGMLATFTKPLTGVEDRERVVEAMKRQQAQGEGERGRLIVILDGINDPGNMGTIIRSAYGLGVDLLLCVNSCDVCQPKVVRSSMGSVLSQPIFELEWKNVVECLQYILPVNNNSGSENVADGGAQLSNCLIVCAESNSADDNDDGSPCAASSVPHTTSLYNFPSKDIILVIGSEAHGISQVGKDTLTQVATHTLVKVCIPMMRRVESFNAAMAASIIIAEINRQRHC